jgi:hypothetical protein
MSAPVPSAIEEYNHRAERSGWSSRFDATLSFEAVELREALAVWRAACNGNCFPARTELTPRRMKSFLGQVAILDLVPAAERIRFRVRLSGTVLEQTFGGLSGHYLDECLPDPVLQRWEAALNLPLQLRGPARSLGRVEFRNQTYLRAETFFGPLGSETVPDAILLVGHVESSVARHRRATDRLIADGPVVS